MSSTRDSLNVPGLYIPVDISSTDANLVTLGRTKLPNRGIACARALYIGGAGNVVVRLIDDQSTDVTLTAVPAGTVIPGAFVQVTKTNTTATSILALY